MRRRLVGQSMVAGLPEEFIKDYATVVADAFIAVPYEVLVRFGRWDDVLAEPGNHPDYLPFTRAFRHAARAIAYAAKGNPVAARAEQGSYLAAVPLVPADELAGNNPVRGILAVVTPMLEGEILLSEGKLEAGLAQLRAAVKAEDAVRYDEPPEWLIPVRHSLGANLMQAGRFAEAEQVYRDDLARLPENGWALFGLTQSLRLQGKEDEAEATGVRFQKVWSEADVQIKSSCLCRPGT